jgi:hypothetical protein
MLTERSKGAGAMASIIGPAGERKPPVLDDIDKAILRLGAMMNPNGDALSVREILAVLKSNGKRLTISQLRTRAERMGDAWRGNGNASGA